MIEKQLRGNPTLLLLAGAVAGIVPAYYLIIGSSNIFAAFLLTLIFSIYAYFLRTERWKLPFLFLVAGFFFALSSFLYQLPENHVNQIFLNQQLERKKVSLKGRLDSVQQAPYAQKCVLEAVGIQLPDSGIFQGTTGKVAISDYDLSRELKPGDDILLHDIELRETRNFNNPGTFDYVTFRKLKGIYLTANASPGKLEIVSENPNSFATRLHEIRSRIATEVLKSPQGGFLLTILLGDMRGVSGSTQEVFSEAGIAHLFAVSGLNVGFIAFAFFFLFKVTYALVCRQFFMESFLNGLFERLAAISTIIPTIGYAILVGEKGSAIRAAVMIVTYLLIFSMGFRRALFNSVNLSAILLLLYNPFFLYDIGFQLSFAAIYAIILGFFLTKTETQDDLLERGFASLDWQDIPLLKTVYTYLKVILLTSVFATLGTFPLILHYFQLLSLAGILVNLIAIPLTAVITPVAFFGMLSIWFSEAFSQLCFAFSGGLFEFMNFVAETTSDISYSYYYFPSPEPGIVLLLYAMLILWAFSYREVNRILQEYSNGFLFLGLLLTLNFLFATKMSQVAQISFLDVGQGESFVIETETGKTILIDGGKRHTSYIEKDGQKIEQEGLDMGKAAVARFLRQKNVRRIDMVVLTHHHDDHSGGLKYIAENFEIGTFYVPPYYHQASSEYKELFGILHERNVPVKIVASDNWLYKSKKTEVRIVAPDYQLEAPDTDVSDNTQVNNLAMVIEVNSFGNRFLLTSDLEKEGELNLLKSYRETVRVLKIGHHGSNTSSTPEFLDALKPEIGVISVAKHNRFRQPSNAVLERLKERNIRVLRTDEAGCIGFRMSKENFEEGGC